MRPGSAFFGELEEKLELLQSLESVDDSHQSADDIDSGSLYTQPSTLSLPYEDDEDVEACDACVYDPDMFSPSSPVRGLFWPSPEQSTYSRDKPLPSTPSPRSSRRWTPPPPPSTPRLTRSLVSSPASSTRSFISSYRFPSALSLPSQPSNSSFPRSRPPSVSSRSHPTHSTFPSISSTLSNLEERISEAEKRSGVYVTNMSATEPQVVTELGQAFVLASPPVRKSSRDALNELADASELSDNFSFTRRKPRPTLPKLTTSISSPQLRTTNALASRSVSPTSAETSSTTTTVRQGAISQPNGSYAFPSLQDIDEPYESELTSRWSMDSNGPLPTAIPSGSRTPVPETPSSPTKARKRDRLFSFMSRRSGSKSSPESPSAPGNRDIDSYSSTKRVSKMTSQPSISTFSLATPTIPDNAPYPAIPISASSSFSTPLSTSTSSSVSSLSTPVGSSPNLPIDPFCASPTSANFSYIPEPPSKAPFDFLEMPPPEPILPLPSPGTPTASFLVPVRPSTNFPILSAISLRRKSRKKRKLIISHPVLSPTHQTSEDDVANEQEKLEMKKRRDRIYVNILRWCETFGTVKNIERKGDGLHIYWKDWEAADTVCRIQGQVSIPNIGTISVAWQYVK